MKAANIVYYNILIYKLALKSSVALPLVPGIKQIFIPSPK